MSHRVLDTLKMELQGVFFLISFRAGNIRKPPTAKCLTNLSAQLFLLLLLLLREKSVSVCFPEW